MNHIVVLTHDQCSLFSLHLPAFTCRIFCFALALGSLGSLGILCFAFAALRFAALTTFLQGWGKPCRPDALLALLGLRAGDLNISRKKTSEIYRDKMKLKWDKSQFHKDFINLHRSPKLLSRSCRGCQMNFTGLATCSSCSKASKKPLEMTYLYISNFETENQTFKMRIMRVKWIESKWIGPQFPRTSVCQGWTTYMVLKCSIVQLNGNEK